LNMAVVLKQQVWNIDKDQPVADVKTEEDALREWTVPRRFNMTMLLSFALIALLISPGWALQRAGLFCHAA
jgi:hypothetical protein